MKRRAAIAGMLLFAALGLAAAVWDGSAVAGVAGDFPDDGLYGACNSFPRDTSVTITNLENGKTVTVAITRNVDNPGVFIALSPKAAAELGMRAGSATRIRAVALVASQADTSLPPTRAGESADPDYNPKVYVDREKAAIAAAAAAPLPLAAVPAAPTPQPAAVAVAPAGPAKPESAEVLARTEEPKKQPAPELPAINEPETAAAATSPASKAAAAVPAAPAPVAAAPKTAKPPLPAAVAVVTPSPAPAKVPADTLPLPEASPTFPGSPRPSPLGVALPSPDAPAIPSESAPTARGGYLAQAPEVLGETKPNPRKAATPRLVFVDPTVPGPKAAAASPAAAAKTPEKASIDALNRPPYASVPPYSLALVEPGTEFGPEELPYAVMSRVTAPVMVVPTPLLAEAAAPESAGELRTKPEAIAFDKPSYAEEVEAAALAEASVQAQANMAAEAYFAEHPEKVDGEAAVAELSEAALPDSPEAIADRRTAGEADELSELQVPDVPSPSEGIAMERPKGVAPAAVAAELAEPGVASPASTGMAPTVVAIVRKGPGEAPEAALSDPEVPTPSESLTAGSPAAAAPGQTVAELAEPDPNGRGIAAITAGKPARAGSPASGELASPAVPNPTESIAAERPAIVSSGEKTVTLEPAMPRPPASAAVAPAAPPAAVKPEQPAAVATITSPKPNGAVQAPGSVPMLKGLAKGSFYVQIGVYGTNDALKTALAGFKTTYYPLAIEKLTTKKGSPAFRLFVGPLSRDESGLVLIRIRSLGFKDAYIRQGS